MVTNHDFKNGKEILISTHQAHVRPVKHCQFVMGTLLPYQHILQKKKKKKTGEAVEVIEGKSHHQELQDFHPAHTLVEVVHGDFHLIIKAVIGVGKPPTRPLSLLVGLRVGVPLDHLRLKKG